MAAAVGELGHGGRVDIDAGDFDPGGEQVAGGDGVQGRSGKKGTFLIPKNPSAGSGTLFPFRREVGDQVLKSHFPFSTPSVHYHQRQALAEPLRNPGSIG